MATNLLQCKDNVEEMAVVLKNYTIILGKAGMLYPDYETADAKQLLHTIFVMYMPLIEAEFNRCRVVLHRNQHQDVDTKIQDLKGEYGNRDAGQWGPHDFTSPLVLLLKLAQDHGDIVFDQEQNDWGRLWSVRQYLLSLNLEKHERDGEKYWPGMPSCILSIVPIWTSHQIVISASNDKFSIKDLRKKGRAFRFARLSNMEKSCTDTVRKRVDDLKSSSAKFKQKYDTLQTILQNGYIYEYEIANLKEDSILMRTHIPGIVTTWSPSGTYHPACLLDYCRFHMLRPPKAEEIEQNGWWKTQVKNNANEVVGTKRATRKKVWEAESCAEWAAFLELARVSTATVTEATQW